MPLLNFKKRFAPLVESGMKRQTIRKLRKRPIRYGDTLYLYTGLRTKYARRLSVPVKCNEVFTTEMFEMERLPGSIVRRFGVKTWFKTNLGDKEIDVEDLARRDGFKNSVEMVEWFRENHGLPFLGQVIRW